MMELVEVVEEDWGLGTDWWSKAVVFTVEDIDKTLGYVMSGDTVDYWTPTLLLRPQTGYKLGGSQ